MTDITFTADDTVSINDFPAETAAVKLSGTFGGGTVTLSIAEGARGTALDLDTATSAYSQEIVVGFGNTLTVDLSGATGTFSLLAQVIPIRKAS